MKLKYLYFFLLIIFFKCVHAKKITPKEYVEKYKVDAVKEMKRSGVPASITLAQGMLESGYGNSELAKKANNHFGIKCHSNWNGAIYRLDDDKKDECFRKYNSVWQSYRDHSDFLRGGKRYAFLFNLKKTDYKEWCRGLKKAGYATNKNYANLLIDMIERYDLNRFVKKNNSKGKYKRNDRKENSLISESENNFELKTTKSSIIIKKSLNWINYIEVKKGDTYYGISKKFSLPLSKLFKYNECNSDTLLEIGNYIYLQPKRSRGTQKVYVFKSGDNVYRISQRFGIKLRHLYKRNNWLEGHLPKEGEKIYLRGNKK